MALDEVQQRELLKRMALLEKMVLRQQVKIEELLTRVEKLENSAGNHVGVPANKDNNANANPAKNTPKETVPLDEDLTSLDAILADDLLSDISRAYGVEPATNKPSDNISPADRLNRTVQNAYRKNVGERTLQSDAAKQNEATKKKLTETVNPPLPEDRQATRRELSPAERLEEFINDYHALYEVSGTVFTRKKAQDDFIREHEVQGLRCSNYQLRLSRPELEPRFVSVTAVREAEYWGMPLGNNLFAVVPSLSLVYNEEYHMAGGMREAFQSNFRRGRVYRKFIVRETATFQFGTVGKIFKRGVLELYELSL